MRAAALGAYGGVFLGADDFAAVVAVPDGYAVPPPQLAGDAPVLHVLHPVVVYLCKPFGYERSLFIHDRIYGGAGERLHLYEPLLGDHRLYGCMAAVAVPHAVRMRFDLNKVAERFELLHHLFAAFVALHAVVLAGELVHRAVFVHYANYGQIVP